MSLFIAGGVRKLAVCTLLVLLLFPTAYVASAAAERLIIESGDAQHIFHVEIADTPSKRSRGLMFRKSMAADAGMLFPFGREEVAHFWMRNTEIPLDMLFVARDGRIADMHEMAVPFSEQAIRSSQAVWAVLELNGGTVKLLGIRVGDRILHAVFSNTD